MRHSSCQQGFSLLEVLVAMIVAALTLGVILNLFSTTSKSASLNTHYRNAVQVAESTMEQLASHPLLTSQVEGNESEYRWQASITPWETASTESVRSPFVLYQIEVQVSWGNRQDYPVVLKTLRLGGPS
ncbi:type IV pilus modification PilV family protein [Amphritea japonica]|uniref:General secretion pathway protein I n=1 Tax=Amphritea japonica ATCC BAA-1530 TaxID=1278309 RepID=A0A7R6PHR6_9GAMM|nr:type II secretion system protein [Amphritea japonica]BBB26757.1 general secretion pathway protein I [Amphritea japonica ATCC BAA-1530]